MTDYRHTVAFKRGTPAERHVTFNAAAPTKTQGWAAATFRWLLSVIGLPGVSIVWLATTWFAASFLTGFFANLGNQIFWAVVALGLSVVKSTMSIVMHSAKQREEEAVWFLALTLLVITGLFSLVASAHGIHGELSKGHRHDIGADLIMAVMTGPLALAIEIVASFGFLVVLIGAKALQDTYDETPPVQEVPVTLEPALGSFEQGFSAWASERLATDVRARLSSPAALQDYSRWAMFNGPYQVPKAESFGRALAAHAEAMGASATRSGGKAVYAGIGLSDVARPISLPKASE